MAAVYDYERATYNRVKARLNGEPDGDQRSQNRRDAWEANAATKSAVARASLLSDNAELSGEFDKVRRIIGDYNQVADREELRKLSATTQERLGLAVDRARRELKAGS